MQNYTHTDVQSFALQHQAHSTCDGDQQSDVTGETITKKNPLTERQDINHLAVTARAEEQCLKTNIQGTQKSQETSQQSSLMQMNSTQINSRIRDQQATNMCQSQNLDQVVEQRSGGQHRLMKSILYGRGRSNGIDIRSNVLMTRSRINFIAQREDQESKFPIELQLVAKGFNLRENDDLQSEFLQNFSTAQEDQNDFNSFLRAEKQETFGRKNYKLSQETPQFVHDITIEDKRVCMQQLNPPKNIQNEIKLHQITNSGQGDINILNSHNSCCSVEVASQYAKNTSRTRSDSPDGGVIVRKNNAPLMIQDLQSPVKVLCMQNDTKAMSQVFSEESCSKIVPTVQLLYDLPKQDKLLMPCASLMTEERSLNNMGGTLHLHSPMSSTNEEFEQKNNTKLAEFLTSPKRSFYEGYQFVSSHNLSRREMKNSLASSVASQQPLKHNQPVQSRRATQQSPFDLNNKLNHLDQKFQQRRRSYLTYT